MSETVEVTKSDARKPSEHSLFMYRIFVTIMTSVCTGLAGTAVLFLATMHNDIVDLRINGAAIVGQFNLINKRVDDMSGKVTEQGILLGAVNGRVIVLEQHVKVKQ